VLANTANAAASAVADEPYQDAIDTLSSLLRFVDGQEPPLGWTEACEKRNDIVRRTRGDVTRMTGR
jgi:hypothetical protein